MNKEIQADETAGNPAESQVDSKPRDKPDLSLPKKFRMPAGGAYQRVFQNRKVLSDPFISIHVLCNGLDHHRLGLGVAKKMFRRAVDRNRVKRLIREAFRLERTKYSGGLDVVVRPKVKELSLKVLRESLAKLIAKAEAKFLPVQLSGQD